jgi:hypothetical protein
MGLTYEWKLIGLKKQNSEIVNDAIVGTNWKITATDEDGNVGTFTGATPFKISEINTGSFTEYSSLTEEQVLGWVKNHVSGSGPSNYMEHINHQIQKEITATKWTKIEVAEADLPWSPISGSTIAPNVATPAPVD